MDHDTRLPLTPPSSLLRLLSHGLLTLAVHAPYPRDSGRHPTRPLSSPPPSPLLCTFASRPALCVYLRPDMLDSWNYHLSPSPSVTSSTRSSHLSSLTTASSSSSQPPSPTGSKTYAFFASPFHEEPSAPQPPPSPASKTYAFFASPFADDSSFPKPPPNPPHVRSGSERSERSEGSDRSEVSAEDTPRVQHTVPARSLNADFFGPSLLPTPPPSIRSISHATSASGSRDNSTSPPSSRVALPPLSRFFPSRARYGSEPDHQPSPATNVRRDFVHLDTAAPSHGHHRDHYHAGEHTHSPEDLHPPQLSAGTNSIHSHAQSPPKPIAHDGKSYAASQRPPSPPLSEPEQPPPYLKLEPGVTLSSSSLSLELVKPLGTGSFSSVWLARDTQGQLNALELVRKSSLARSKSLRGRRSRTIDGTRPLRSRRAKERAASDGSTGGVLSPKDEEPAKQLGNPAGGRLVAVKMTERSVCDSNSRSKVSFVREVEVLRVSLS